MSKEIVKMPTAAGEGLELIKYEDVLFPNINPINPVKGLNYAKELEYRPGDILICTYPKRGTHWMGNTIWKLKTFDMTSRPMDIVVEFHQREIFENKDSPMIICTHQKPSRLPIQHIKTGGKIVLMLRNPKDVMVSLFYHLKNAIAYQRKQTWDEFFDSFISGMVMFGSYFDYAEQWEEFLAQHSNSSNIQVFYYEDVKANCDENLARLNRFYGFNRDDQYLEKVKAETTITALRERDALGKRKTHNALRKKNGDPAIYRKGVVGDWQSHMTVAQSETVD